MKVFRTFASGLIMRRKLIETYIWVCTPIDARADEGDELMTTLVNHEAANWGKIFLFLGFDYFYVLIIEKAPGKGAHHLILFRIRILWIGFGLMMLWKNLLDLLTFFVIDILCLGRSFHCTVFSDNDLRYYWKSYLLEKDIWYCLMMIYDIFRKAYLGIDNPACRSPCNKINISQSL